MFIHFARLSVGLLEGADPVGWSHWAPAAGTGLLVAVLPKWRTYTWKDQPEDVPSLTRPPCFNLCAMAVQPWRGKRSRVPAGRSCQGGVPVPGMDLSRGTHLHAGSLLGEGGQLRGSKHVWDLSSFLSLPHSKIFLCIIPVKILPAFLILLSGFHLFFFCKTPEQFIQRGSIF